MQTKELTLLSIKKGPRIPRLHCRSARLSDDLLADAEQSPVKHDSRGYDVAIAAADSG